MVNSHTWPSDSTTVERGPWSASAAARVGYVCRCQNSAESADRRPISCRAVMKHPYSRPARSAAGTQVTSVWAVSGVPAAAASARERQRNEA
jgi:hypothetical protein